MPQLAQNAAGLVTPQELLSRPEIVQARNGSASHSHPPGGAGGRRPAGAVCRCAGAWRGGEVGADRLPGHAAAGYALDGPAGRRCAGSSLRRSLGAVLLASAAGLLLARRISRPLDDLVGAAHAVAAGDLDQTVPEDPAIPELDGLGRPSTA